MATRLWDAVERWCAAVGINPNDRPSRARVESAFAGRPDPIRPASTPAAIYAWEHRHGFLLPEALKAWLLISDGLMLDGSLLHPLSAIGPMVPFAQIPSVVVQPESWFEIGNPGEETVCIDLAYRWLGGDFPIFTSGDDLSGSRPRIIAPGFTPWFLGLLENGGHQFWFERNYPTLGEPWQEHRRNVPAPELPATLQRLADRVGALVEAGSDDRAISVDLGISRLDVESILRHLQHGATLNLPGDKDRPAFPSAIPSSRV